MQTLGSVSSLVLVIIIQTLRKRKICVDDKEQQDQSNFHLFPPCHFKINSVVENWQEAELCFLSCWLLRWICQIRRVGQAQQVVSV